MDNFTPKVLSITETVTNESYWLYLSLFIIYIDLVFLSFYGTGVPSLTIEWVKNNIHLGISLLIILSYSFIVGVLSGFIHSFYTLFVILTILKIKNIKGSETENFFTAMNKEEYVNIKMVQKLSIIKGNSSLDGLFKFLDNKKKIQTRRRELFFTLSIFSFVEIYLTLSSDKVSILKFLLTWVSEPQQFTERLIVLFIVALIFIISVSIGFISSIFHFPTRMDKDLVSWIEKESKNIDK